MCSHILTLLIYFPKQQSKKKNRDCALQDNIRLQNNFHVQKSNLCFRHKSAEFEKIYKTVTTDATAAALLILGERNFT